MDQSPVNKALEVQFKRAFHMFRNAVVKFPEEEWRLGETPDLRPAGLAYHLLETIVYYTGEMSSERFPWGQRFGVDWESEDPALLPSQAQIQAYLKEVEGKLSAWLLSTDLLATEKSFKWTGYLVLDRAVYTLRHTQHHVGELSRELDSRGFSGPEWR